VTIEERMEAYDSVLSMRDIADYRFRLALVMAIVEACHLSPFFVSSTCCVFFHLVLTVVSAAVQVEDPSRRRGDWAAV
jgi:hypothetical protein